jgi:cytochrome c biogenesis protein CcmG/thiol:disulfide interchange protein DsbE
VIFIVAIVAAIMIFAAIHQAKKSGNLQQRASMVGDVHGKLAPDFTLKTIDGKSVKLSDLRGKAVLLNFWATWCEPCKVEIPWFVDLQKQYADQGLQIVGVAMDDNASPQKIEAFTKQLGVNYTILLGNDAVADQYGGIENLPTTFYVGRDGKIVQRVVGLVGRKDTEEHIKTTLATHNASARSASHFLASAVTAK